jgi:hypothetical protein
LALLASPFFTFSSKLSATLRSWGGGDKKEREREREREKERERERRERA